MDEGRKQKEMKEHTLSHPADALIMLEGVFELRANGIVSTIIRKTSIEKHDAEKAIQSDKR